MIKEEQFEPFGAGEFDFAKFFCFKRPIRHLLIHGRTGQDIDRIKPLEVIKTSYKGFEQVGLK